MLIHRLATLTGLAVATLFLAAPANALTMAECSTKYNAAKDAGTLNGQTWNQFRKAECGTDAAATTAETKPAKKTAKASDAAKSDTKAAAAADDNAAKGLTAKECSTKYQAAKAAGTLNGMKWNDFRKTECGAGATAAAADAKPAKTTKAAAATEETAKGLTAKECSAKYQAAKAAGTLNGMKWNDFRKAECGPGATAAAEPAKATTKAAAAEGGKGLSMADCSAKYQAAKTANKLNGMKWNDFRKAECGAAADDDDTVPAPTEATYTSEPEKPTVAAPKGVKFPTAISKKYASETPGKGRMHTCLELYYANKDANTLNGLRWIQKGGGFYSLCNAKLKS
ncbi:hypothetical protein [Mesorhizobium sp.]|uniref:hypothetical protein n=1 Tax=Mesorhizobium sp. TaxID=1871066 RepID=UPI000FE6ADF4|nr:hypothetical protein [Mesorhizobium sp.]RWA64890.1 MAG: hypothetical protein EOQ27_06165 [Mesorhizobium sp.]RWF37886.1 MAG: hypothetical protein EOS65_25685 [Mesorhizobium sp.]TJW04467.1 MAG: hypothetical protein E5W97_16525 [Mesorhizobium sp.]